MLAVRGIVTGAQSLDSPPWMSSSLPCYYPNRDPREDCSPPSHASLDPTHDNEGDVCGEEKTDPNCVSQMRAPLTPPSSLLSPHFTTTPSMIQRSTFGNSHLENVCCEATATFILYSVKYIYMFMR